MHVHGLGGGVGARAVPESWEIEDFYAFPLFGLWCEGVRAAPESLEMQRILCISMWFGLCGGRGRHRKHWECNEFQKRLHGLGGGVAGAGGSGFIGRGLNSIVWVVVWGARAAPESLEMH